MIKKLKQEKWMWEGAEQRDYSWPRFLAEFAFITISQKWNERKCQKGHDFGNEEGNPESGSYSVECTRCGYGISGYW